MSISNQNPKSEAQNPKQTQNSKIEIQNGGACFEFRPLGFLTI
jgi:hypothetical protein